MPLAQWIQGLGYLGVFLAVFVENLGIPFPVIFGLLAGVAIVSTGQGSVALVLIALAGGQIVGAAAGYCLGAGGSQWVLRRLESSEGRRRAYQRILGLSRRWGWGAVFACRFIGYVRPWASIAAGIVRMPFIPFILATTAGVIGWTAINWILIYYGSSLFMQAAWFRWVAAGIFAVAILGVAAFWTFWGRQGESHGGDESDPRE